MRYQLPGTPSISRSARVAAHPRSAAKRELEGFSTRCVCFPKFPFYISRSCRARRVRPKQREDTLRTSPVSHLELREARAGTLGILTLLRETRLQPLDTTLGLDLSPFLAQRVKTQNSSNGEFESWGYRAGSSRKSSRLPRCGS